MLSFIITFLLACFAALFVSTHQSPSSTDKPAPIAINPHPKYFLDLHGVIEPGTLQQDRLVLEMNYQTNVPKDECQENLLSFDPGPGPQEKVVRYVFMPDARRHYHAKIPLDYFLPGVCGWKVDSLLYTNNEVDRGEDLKTDTLITFFGDEMGSKSDLPSVIYDCSLPGHCIARDDDGQELSSSHDYKMELSFYVKKP